MNAYCLVQPCSIGANMPASLHQPCVLQDYTDRRTSRFSRIRGMLPFSPIHHRSLLGVVPHPIGLFIIYGSSSTALVPFQFICTQWDIFQSRKWSKRAFTVELIAIFIFIFHFGYQFYFAITDVLIL